MVERDRIGHAHGAACCHERRLQHVGALHVFTLDAEVDLRSELERPAALGVEQSGEDGVGIEARQGEPIDRPVAGDERTRPPVPDQGVVLDRRVAVDPLHGLNYRCPKWCAAGNEPNTSAPFATSFASGTSDSNSSTSTFWFRPLRSNLPRARINGSARTSGRKRW